MNTIRAFWLALAAAVAIAIAAAAPAAATHTITPGYYPSQLSPNSTTLQWGSPAPEALLSQATGTTCSGSARPGAVNMADYLKYWYGTRTIGIYNCRTVSGSGSLSLHGEGRAVDYHVDAFISAEKAIGDRIFAFFRKSDTDAQAYVPMRRFGVQEVIWNCRIYTAGNMTVRTYSYCANGGTNKSQRHEDHVHIGLNREGAERRRTAWTGYRPCYDGHASCP